MSEDRSFADLMARLQGGDDEAAARVFRRFARRLIALAQTHLSAALRQKEDPEDVVQSAFKSFFRRQADRPYEVDDWNNLWSLLALITVRKCQDRAEAFGAACRDIRREAVPTESSAAGWDAFDREPTPEEALMLTETLEEVLRGLIDRDRDIAMRSLQGWAVLEISEQLGCTVRTVYRVLARVKKRLQALRADDDSTS